MCGLFYIDCFDDFDALSITLFVVSASFSDPKMVAAGKMLLLPVEPNLMDINTFSSTRKSGQAI